MKKISLLILAVLAFACCRAQEELAFPFQGGNTVMTQFFKDSLTVSPELKLKKAVGTVVFKFTADEKGNIQKIIVYYADDAILVGPVIEALQRSKHKWIIPDHEKTHDFILPFSISFNPPATGGLAAQKALYAYYRHRKPLITLNQVPLNTATLLPTITINYDL